MRSPGSRISKCPRSWQSPGSSRAVVATHGSCLSCFAGDPTMKPARHVALEASALHSPRASSLVYVAIGMVFGIVLVKSEVLSWFRIQEMFRFQAFHMVRNHRLCAGGRSRFGRDTQALSNCGARRRAHQPPTQGHGPWLSLLDRRHRVRTGLGPDRCLSWSALRPVRRGCDGHVRGRCQCHRRCLALRGTAHEDRRIRLAFYSQQWRQPVADPG